MKYKKIMILAIFLVSLLTISAVSAAEKVTSDVVSIEETTDDIAFVSASDFNDTVATSDNYVELSQQLSDKDNLSSSESSLLKDNSYGTFDDLASEIGNAKGVLNLTRDYVYTNGCDSKYNEGIIINKMIIINGNGHYINGDNHQRAFKVNCSDVILQDICFKWCSVSSSNSSLGGAVYWCGDNGVLNNCSFNNCYASSSYVSTESIDDIYTYSFGGAVYWCGDNGVLCNCSFNDCYASSSSSYSKQYSYSSGYIEPEHIESVSYSFGGAIYWNGVKGSLLNSNFENCSTLSYARSYAIYSGYFEYEDNSKSYGGAVYSGATEFLLSNNIFYHCKSSSKSFLINSVFSDNNPDSSGGAISLDSANDTLNNCSFINCSARSGGAILWGGTNGILGDCSFVNCSSNEYGGNIYWIGSNGILGDCSFVNCSSGEFGYGGSIYWIGSNGVIFNSSFINCSVGDTGGAIYWNAVNGKLYGCNFSNCMATADGGNLAGAVYWQSDRSVLSNCSFMYCHSEYIGAISWRGDNSILCNCSFVSCYSSSTGAISWGGDNSILCNCSFVSCYSRAISWRGDNSILCNCSFINCSSKDGNDGGAISWYSSNGVLSNCSFINCSTLERGGAIFLSYEKVVLTDCNFINCSAKLDGGAVYWKNSDGILRNCSFINCSAFESGGAIYWFIKNGFISNCSFINNSAVDGGAIYWYGDDGVVSNSKFINNSAVDGGAIYWYGDDGVVSNSKFINNSAVDGGAIYWYGDDGVVSNSKFMNNSVGSNGFAIIFCENSNIIMDSLFFNNSGEYDIFSKSNVCQIIDCVNYKINENCYIRHKSFIYLNVPQIINFSDTLILNMEVISGATGNISIYIDDEFLYDVPVNAIVKINNLSARNHTIKCIYNGDNYYGSCKNFTFIKVNKVDSQFSISEIAIAKNTIFNIKINKTATGVITIHVNNKKYNGIIDNGAAVINILDLTAGYYNFTIEYGGDGNFNPSRKYLTDLCIKSQVNLNIFSDNFFIDEIATIDYDITSGVTGIFSIYANNTFIKNVSVGDEIELEDLKAGIYIIKVIYNGEGYFVSCENTTELEIYKLCPNYFIEEEYDIVSGNNINLTFVFNEDATGNVNISLGQWNTILDGSDDWISKYEFSSKLVNGVASIIVPNLCGGWQDYVLEYEGDERYDSLWDCDEFYVEYKDSPININLPEINWADNVILNPILPNGATGFISLLLDNISLANISVGSTCQYTALKGGKHYLTIKYSGDDYFVENETTFEFYVNKLNTTCSITNNTEAGDYLPINVTLNEDATGNITVLLNDKYYLGTLENGSYVFTVPNIKAGLYDLTIIYGGDSKYNSFNKDEILNVTLKKTVLTLDLKNILSGNNVNINPYVSEGAIGYIDIYVDDVFEQSVNVGSGYILTKPLIGKHEVKIGYVSDGYFQSCENTSVFWVFSQYPIDAKDTYIIYNSGNYFNANFYDEYHNPLSDKYVVFSVGGKDYARLTDSYGVATLDLDLDIGEYNITSINTIYNENTTNKLVVYTSILSENLTRAYNSGNDFNATFFDDAAKALSNTYVVFKVDGIDYTVKTNMNGQAVLNVPLAIGTHEIISINTLTNENKINILDIVPSIQAEDMLRAYNSTMDYKATFTGANSNYLINTTVTFEVGLDKYNIMTNEYGVAILNVPLTVGEYNVTAINPVTGEKLTKKLNIVERIINNENMVIFTDSETYFRVTVIGDNGEFCGSGETIIFTFNDNNYSIKTDQYGYASLLISSLDNGLYPIHATYKGYTVSNNITVFKNLESVILIDVGDADYLDNVKFNVSVLPQYAHGNLTISITSNNGYLLEFNSTADETFTKELVGLNASDYVISVKFIDMDNYYTSQDVEVFKVLKIDPKIIVVVDDAEFGQNATITVNIPQVTGNVTIAIGDKKNFKDYMPKDGVIIKRINDLNVGEYDVTVTYEGNDNYNKLTKVAKLNVNKIPVNIIVPNVIEEILEINLPSDASGNVIVTINNKNYGSEVKNGNAKIDLSLLYNGDYQYELTYSGDNKYLSFSDSGILKVNKVGGDAPVWNNWNFNVDFDDAVIYEDDLESETWIYVYNLANSANAKLSLFIDDKLVKTQMYSIDYDEEYDDSDLSTDISFDASKLSEGIHKWKITYYDEDNHINSTQSGLFKVYKVGSPDKQFLVNKNGTVSEISGEFKFIKNGTLVVDDDYEETYAIYSFTADGIEYMAIHWFPVTFYSVECYKVFNPNDYKEYDRIYYKTIDGTISEVIDNYEVIDGVYYADIGRLYDYYNNGYDKHYFVLNGTCYKTQFYHYYEAIEGEDYKVIDGKYYTLDGIEIMDESLYYDGFVIVKNGRYYFNDNLYFYHIMSTVGYNYVKLNNEFYRLVQTWNSDYSVEKNYALINGKLYSVVNENIDSAIELDIKEQIKDVVIPDLNEPSANGEVTINLPSDATGIVTLTINKKDYNFAVVNGVANVIIPSLTNGDYPYTITYSGDGKYSSFTNEGSLKVNKTDANPVENQTGDNKDNDSSSNNATKPTPDVVVPPLDNLSSDGSVTITLPSDATGTVILTINDKNYSFDVVSGKANVKLPDLANGDYKYKITYSGDSKYSTFTHTGNMKVNNTAVNPSNNTTNSTGNATNDNTSDTNTTNATEGNSSETNTTKPVPEIVIPSLDEPSDDGSVTITLPSDATGKVTLAINGKSYNYLVENGVANVIIPKLADGDYPYTITYSGDAKYSSFTNEGSLRIDNIVDNPVNNSTDTNITENDTNGNTTKPVPEIVVPPLDQPTSDGLIPVTLPADATGTVTLTVNGNDYKFSVENGVASVKLPELANGDYPYTIKYSGDSKYSSFVDSGSLKVENTVVVDNRTSENKTDANATKPTVKPDVVIPPLDNPSSDGPVTVKLPSDATGKVTLTINGKDYNYLVENGVANVIIPNLGDGDYPYTITYSGDSKYSSFTNTGSLKVNKTTVNPADNQTNTTGNTSQENTTIVDNSKIVASNKKVTYATGKYYTIKVYGEDGQLANGVKVVITVNGKTFKTLTTKDGVAKFKVTQKPGTYKMTITALNKNVTKTLTVKHLVTLKAVTVKKSAKKLVLQATLGKVNGKYLNKKTVTFKFNGKKYTAKTNKKGVAKLTIKNAKSGKNTYNFAKLKVGKKVTYQATYSKDTVKKTVKVKK